MEKPLQDFLQPKESGLGISRSQKEFNLAYRPKSSSQVRYKMPANKIQKYSDQEQEEQLSQKSRPKSRIIYRYVGNHTPDPFSQTQTSQSSKNMKKNNFFEDKQQESQEQTKEMQHQDKYWQYNRANSAHRKFQKTENFNHQLTGSKVQMRSNSDINLNKLFNKPKRSGQQQNGAQPQDDIQNHKSLEKNLSQDHLLQMNTSSHLQTETNNQKDFCFTQEDDIDSNIFDSISQSDLQAIISPEVLYSSNIDLNKLVEDNSQYFYHLTGQCACKKCTCGICKCDFQKMKISYLSGLKTTYGKDFYGKDLYGKIPLITDKMLITNFGPWNQLGNYQTLKNDFQVHPIQPTQKYKKLGLKNSFPIQKGSSYTQNFKNWQDYNIQHYKTPQHVSTSTSIPFLGRTTYSDSFNKSANGSTRQKHIVSDQGVMPKNSFFFGETTFQKDYKGLRYGFDENKDEKEGFKSVPQYNGQFCSTMTKDYKQLSTDKCPMKKGKQAFKDKLLQKLETLRVKKFNKEIQSLSDRFQPVH